MVTIIDYGLGNISSVNNMVKKLGFKSIITSDIETIDKAESKKKKIDIHPKHEVTAKQKIKTNLVFIFTVCIRS